MKYTTKVQVEAGDLELYWYTWSNGQSGNTVMEAENTSQYTGLLNSQGEPLYRIPEKRRIGYV